MPKRSMINRVAAKRQRINDAHKAATVGRGRFAPHTRPAKRVARRDSSANSGL